MEINTKDVKKIPLAEWNECSKGFGRYSMTVNNSIDGVYFYKLPPGSNRKIWTRARITGMDKNIQCCIIGMQCRINIIGTFFETATSRIVFCTTKDIPTGNYDQILPNNADWADCFIISFFTLDNNNKRTCVNPGKNWVLHFTQESTESYRKIIYQRAGYDI